MVREHARGRQEVREHGCGGQEYCEHGRGHQEVIFIKQCFIFALYEIYGWNFTNVCSVLREFTALKLNKI